MSSAIDDPEVTGESSEKAPEAPHEPASAWGDRLRALRNVPPSFTLCGSRGPRSSSGTSPSASSSLSCPSASASSAGSSSTGSIASACTSRLPQHFWWLVAAEMALAVVTGILARSVDYFDNLLADRYTHHVSVEVMRKAAALDVTAYEDPVFYDRLERARVQATDRLAMIQQMGRLIQQVGHRHRVLRGPRQVFAVAAAAADRRRHSRVSGREPLRVPRLRQELPPDAAAAPDGLSAPGGRQQRSAKELKLFGLSEFLTDRFTALSQTDLRAERRAQSAPAFLGRRAGHRRAARLLRRLCLQSSGAPSRAHYSIGDLTLITAAIMQASANIQLVFSTASGVADQALFLTDLLAFFEMKPTRRVQGERAARAAADHARLRVPQCFVRLSRHRRVGSRATSISPSVPASALR